LEDQGWSAERGRCPIAIGDFDGDGLLDIVLADQLRHRVTVLLAQPDGSWRPGGSYPAAGPTALAVGDFNRDGIADVAVGNAGGNNVAIMLGVGDGRLRLATTIACERPACVAAQDVNGDGLLDLVVVEGGRISVFLGRGDGGFDPVAFVSGRLDGFLELAQRYPSEDTTWSPASPLTAREWQVVELAAQAYSCAEIALRLGIGRRTVESHLATARGKLRVGSKRDLVRLLS
jgi:DNA-binding CsgD family transcriptional regulator